MPDVTDVIGGNAAHINADGALLNGLKNFLFSGRCIEYLLRHFFHLYASGKERRDLQAGIFLKSTHDVHILHGLSGRPFHQIVYGRHDNDPFCPRINSQPNVAVI